MMLEMNLLPLFSAMDQKPFRPFAISLTSGERFEITHPDNIFVLPTRQQVNHLEVYKGDGSGAFTIIWPEALAALHYNGERTELS